VGARIRHGPTVVHRELHRWTQLAEDRHGPAPVLVGDVTPQAMDARSPGLMDERVYGGYLEGLGAGPARPDASEIRQGPTPANSGMARRRQPLTGGSAGKLP
jgi:hypothetical protein